MASDAGVKRPATQSNAAPPHAGAGERGRGSSLGPAVGHTMGHTNGEGVMYDRGGNEPRATVVQCVSATRSNLCPALFIPGNYNAASFSESDWRATGL